MYTMSRFTGFLPIALLFQIMALAADPDTPARTENEEGESPLGRTEWFLNQRLNHSGQVGAHERLRALARRQHLEAVGDAAFPAQNWQLIGPEPENVQEIPISAGRVTALVVDPRSSTTVYAGTAEGGVWKTTDGGVNWLPLTDMQESLAIGSLALDPENPDTVYAGTGEGNFNADAYFGAGLLKSTDAGVTWTLLGQDYFTGDALGSIAVSPTNSQALLAAGLGGVFRSVDGGITWSNPASNLAATAVVFDPADGTQAWAGICNVFQDISNGLYRSADGGATWTLVSTPPLPQPNSASGIGRIAIAIAPSNPQIIYVGMSAITPNTTFLGSFLSTDGGTTWAANATGYEGDWYRNAIAISPIDPTFAVGGGLDIYFTQNQNVSWFGGDPTDALHVDQHAFAFSADGSMLYVGNDGGVFSSTTTGTGPVWTSLNSTLSITQFYPGFAINPSVPTLAIGGTQDNGTLVYSGNLKWSYATCGDGGAALVEPQNPQNVYVTCEEGGLFHSESGGAPNSFEHQMSGVPTSEIPFVGVLAADPSDQDTVWWGGVTNLWVTTTGALTWTKATASLPANSIFTVSAIGVVSSDGNTVIFGDLAGNLFCSSNAKSTASVWTACGSTVPNGGGPIASVIADPAASGAAYMTETGYGNDHIFHTTNGGQTWTDLQGDLPDVPVSAVCIDQTAGFLYAATDVGVFMTANNGGHWQPLGNGLPNTVVTGLQFFPSPRLLRAASHGRSMWDITLPVQAPTLASNGIVNSANFAAAVPGSIAAAFGTSLTDGVESASVIPLPSSLAGATLTIGSLNAPVFFASPGQMNVQIPWETPVGTASATLTIGAQASTASQAVAQYAPGIYTLNASGQGQGVIVNSLTNAWAAATGSIAGVNAAPVTAGVDYITIYCTGLGPVTNQPATGAAAGSSPLSQTTQGVTVTIGTVTSVAPFAGLAPGFVGFYQVNVPVPAGIPASSSVPVTIAIGGVTSNSVTIAVQ
jgi:uncharacterized protein (TIGR03437 family)